MTTVISVENLSKSYRLGQIGTGTFANDLKVWWAKMRGKPNPLLRIGETDHGNQDGEDLWALRDVSFTVEQGEVLGIIGKNGAGKSTLLKILSRVTAPTSGAIKVKGRVASLLEVGTGFHPELTGRENIYLNGALLGMTKQEVNRKFDEIVDFSGVEKFIDTPVKRYSSGMYVRLAFAVAAHLDPEILVVDEVLAVGDAEFQKKCLGKMSDVAQGGRTILFVSHNMAAVMTLCKKCVLFENGRITMSDLTAKVIAHYQSFLVPSDDNQSKLENVERKGTGKARFSSVLIQSVDAYGKALPVAQPGCDLLIDVTVRANADISDTNVAIVIFDIYGFRLIDVNTALKRNFLSLLAGHDAKMLFRLRNVLLRPGTYLVSLWLGRGGVEDIDSVDYATRFNVVDDPSQIKHTEVFPGAYLCNFDVSISKKEMNK